MGAAMRHSGPRPAVPPDPDPRWPIGYMAVLREAGAQEKAIPYCIGWVRRFFAAYPGRERRELGRTEIETFPADLAARAGVTNWQVQQARDSLELYYERFLEIPLAPRTGIEKPHAPSPPAIPSAAISVGRPVASMPKHAHSVIRRPFPDSTVGSGTIVSGALPREAPSVVVSKMTDARPVAGTSPHPGGRKPGPVDSARSRRKCGSACAWNITSTARSRPTWGGSADS